MIAECTSTRVQCVNCKQAHPSGSRACVVFQTWSGVQQVRHVQAISRQRAEVIKITETTPAAEVVSGQQETPTYAGAVKRQLVKVLANGEEQVMCQMPSIPMPRKNTPKKQVQQGGKLKTPAPTTAGCDLLVQNSATLKTMWEGVKFFIRPWLEENPEVARLIELLENAAIIDSLQRFLSKPSQNV